MNIKKKYYLFALSVIPILVIFRLPSLTSQTQMTSQSLISPLLTAGRALSYYVHDVTDSFMLFWHTYETQQENRDRIQVLQAQLEDSEEIKRENQRLAKLLKFRAQFEESKVVASRVVAWDISPWKKTVILGSGKAEGIRKDMAVTVPSGLAGRVLNVGNHTSRVILLIDPESRVSALTSDSRSQGVLSGNGSGTVYLRYVELGSGIKVGETVITSGVTGIFPKGIRIGKVISIEKDKGGLHLIAEVEPFVRFSKLEEVLCTASSPLES